MFVDTETVSFEAESNPAMNQGGGAGIQAAQFVVERGAQAVLTGNLGPNAYNVLAAVGIPGYLVSGGTVRQAVEAFNSREYDKVVISVEADRNQSGKFWVDDLQVEEIGMVNLLRRPGTPVTVRGEKNGTVYEEGRDFARLEDSELNFRFNHEGPEIELLSGSRISIWG